MTTNGTSATLTLIGDGVWAWIHPLTDPLASNAALVLDDDGLTVIDSDGLGRHHTALAAAVAELGHPLRRLVLTHAHLDHVAGATAIGAPQTFATPATIEALKSPAQIAPLQALNPALADEIGELGNPGGVQPLADLSQITPRIRAVECAGHSTSDLVLQIDDAGICVAADMCFFGAIPFGIQGDFDLWADSIATVAELGPTFVPGHGAIGDRDDVDAVAAYIDAVREAADADSMPAGPWDEWRDAFAERLPRATTQINIERHQLNRSGEAGLPATVLKLLTPA